MLRVLLIALLPATLSPVLWAGERVNFDEGWRFHLGDLPGAERADFDDASWRPLRLPHDWSVERGYDERNPSGPAGGFLAGGVGWYRKHFVWSGDADSWARLAFDGVYRNADVWLNGNELGRHAYGYLGFAFSELPYLHHGDNVVAVRVDDSQEPSSRWAAGCGIFRHVWWEQSGSVHLQPDGLALESAAVTPGSAQEHVVVGVQNSGARPRHVRAELTICDPAGQPVATASADLDIAAGGTGTVRQILPVPKPGLWSTDHPQLYRLHVRLLDDATTLDEEDTPFGIRTFRFDAATGFSLNGQRLKWRGMALHEGGTALGAVAPTELIESRLRQLKAMGVNAVRTAHNPFAPEFYAACDRLGLMVMDEAFDGWHRKAAFDYGAQGFANGWRDDLAALVARDRNHPSVILWSIGNETGASDRFGLSEVLHGLDPSRPTTGGQVRNGVDVAGWNGPAEEPAFTTRWDRDKPMILTECPHTFQTRGFYRTLTWWRDENNPRWNVPDLTAREVFHDDFAASHSHKITYNSSYDNAGIRICIRQSLERTRDTDFISGENRWTAFDYLGESFGWPLRMGNFGIIDTCGFPKDAYYLYQSQWTTAPMVHLLPHWTHRTLARGTVIPVWAYSNCETVELSLNGRPLGRRSLGSHWQDMNASWDVPYQPGVLSATGWRAGRKVAEETLRTAGAPARLRLESDNGQLTVGGEDLAQVTATIEDAAGNFVPYGDARVHFTLLGPATWRGADNGDPADLENNELPDRRAFHGLCKAFVGSGLEGGPVLLGAAAILGDRALIASHEVAIDAVWVKLRNGQEKPSVSIRYTTDGSPAGADSPLYSSPLRVADGTTVNAIVYFDGLADLRMSERFSRDTLIEDR